MAPKHFPPRWARAILARLLRGEDREATLAELDELYSLRAERRGRLAAIGWYVRLLPSFPSSGLRSAATDGGAAAVDSASRGARRALTADVAQDVRYALRGFRKTPGFTAIAVLTLGLGIGATAAIYTIIQGVLLAPLPYDHPGELVAVDLAAPGVGPSSFPQTAQTYVVLDEGTRSFDAFGAWAPTTVTVSDAGNPERVDAAWMTDGVLRALRAEPMVGRGFGPADGERSGPQTVILDYGYWQGRLGGDPAILGRTIRINGEDRQVIGVMPRGFHLLDANATLYLPFILDERAVGPTISFDYLTLGRLAPGVTREAAAADLDRLLPQAGERFEGITKERMSELGFRTDVHDLKDNVVGSVGRTLWLLFGAVGLVFLIAIANVANLFLVRAESRRREVAVRTALGASHQRLARQFLVESSVLGLLGGVAGLLLARVGVGALLRLAPEALPRSGAIGIDLGVVVFTAGVALVGALGFGLVPVMFRGRAPLADTLRAGDRGSGPSRRRLRTQGVLAVAEVALALVLVVGAGLMVRSMVALQHVRPGFDTPDRVLTFRITIPHGEVPDASAVPVMHRRILEALTRVPGVTAVGAASGVPLEGHSNRNSISPRDPSVGTGESMSGYYKGIAGDFLGAMHIPLLAGRTLTWEDLQQRRPVALVSENVARGYWGDPASALGQAFRHDPRDPWREIVGVVGDVHEFGLDREPPAGVYYPVYVEQFLGFPWFVRRSLTYTIRTDRRDPLLLTPEVRRAVWSVSPTLPLADLRTMQSLMRDSTARGAFMMTLLGLAATMAVVLGLVGTYGVIAYAVSSRRREIGVRLALGARPLDVRGMVLRRTLAVAAAGTAIGLAAAIGLTRVLESQLFGVTATDPLTFAAAAAGIGLAALAAGWWPARRAAQVDPMETLRAE